MKPFQVLNPEQKIHQNIFLEASAGTGKTYSIENLVVRLLVEESPRSMQLENILVVTFTNAAVRDLKRRIRSNLEKTCAVLNGQALRRIEEALFNFDSAPIFTIHAFCLKMLQENAFEGGFARSSDEEAMLSNVGLLEIVKNTFLTEINTDLVSSAQLEIALKHVGGHHKLLKSLLNTVQKGIEIEPTPSFKTSFEQFSAKITLLRQRGLEKEKLLEDFRAAAPHYKDICDISKTIKRENEQMAERFAVLFEHRHLSPADLDTQIRDALYLRQAFDPSQKKKKANLPTLHYPDLFDVLDTRTFGPLYVKRPDLPLFLRA